MTIVRFFPFNRCGSRDLPRVGAGGRIQDEKAGQSDRLCPSDGPFLAHCRDLKLLEVIPNYFHLGREKPQLSPEYLMMKRQKRTGGVYIRVEKQCRLPAVTAPRIACPSDCHSDSDVLRNARDTGPHRMGVPSSLSH